jgi:prepilin-type N-terminal cleavage/methylation domain-containing protein
MNMNMKRNNAGFTLVEIAIVLVIIGLLLGGVLKGQEMIQNAKIKNLINDINGISTAFQGYRDRYKALPGDDARAASRGWTDAVAGNGGGTLQNNNAFLAGNTGENMLAWQHLRYAGFISGDPAGTTQTTGGRSHPRHAYDGYIGVANSSSANFAFGMRGNVVCVSNVPGKAAEAVDSEFDDGIPNTGNVRARTGNINTEPGNAGTAAASYLDDSTSFYTLCKLIG